MNWNEVLKFLNIENRELVATIIEPVRKDPIYKKGKVMGFKPGIYGGGHYNYKEGVPMSFDSGRMRQIKKPKVLIEYNVFTYGGSSHCDWINVDNCEFEIIDVK
jgi:hypothetical protein